MQTRKISVKLILSICISLYGWMSTCAEKSADQPLSQTFRAAALYDCSGPVKQIVMSQNDALGMFFPIVYFTPEGRQSVSLFDYNAEGYPTKLQINGPSAEINVRVDYNDKWQPERFEISSNLTGEPKTVIVKNKYEDGQLKTREFFNNESQTPTNVYSFSKIEVDEYGNWISREVEGLMKSGDKGVYTETRTINYYQ